MAAVLRAVCIVAVYSDFLFFSTLRISFVYVCTYVGPSQCQSSTATVTGASATQPIKTDSTRLGKRRRPSCKPENDADRQLMNRWLQSEIDKNIAKQTLMAAQKELIDLKKAKLEQEIKQLELQQILSIEM